MTARQRHALAGSLALAFALVTLSAIFIPSHPDTVTMTPEEVAIAFDREGHLQAAQAYVHALGATFLLAFVASLYPILRRAEGGDGALSLAALASGSAAAAFLVVPAALSLALLLNRPLAEPATFQYAYVVSWIVMFFVHFILPVFLVAVGLLAVRARALPRAIGYAAFAVAAAELLATAGVLAGPDVAIPLLAVPFMLVLVWSIAAGAALLVGSSAPRPEVGAEPAA